VRSLKPPTVLDDLPQATRSYLDIVKLRLKQGGFSRDEHATYQSLEFQVVALRRKFEASKTGRAKTCFTFSIFPALDPAGLQAFSAGSVAHG
jgi:hypothetical protein